uniref:DUF1758 domain-containing protein n=1 Tax=Heterorhabditis bacteriophora TaxID=37862 RepID=A0A1I7X0J4_HETBA
MATQFKYRKGELSTASSAVKKWLNTSEQWEEIVFPSDSSNIFAMSQAIQKDITRGAAELDNVKDALDRLTKAYDEVEGTTCSDDDQVNRLISGADALYHEARERLISRFSGTVMRPTEERSTGSIAPTPKLADIPLPKFNGKIWEWESFWQAFETNVHNQNLTEYQKFRYLNEALLGDAKSTINRFQLVEDNYAKAIAALKKKYGDKESVIFELNNLLKQSSARGKGESMDNRLILRKKETLTSTSPWNMETMLEVLEEVISAEEKLEKEETISESQQMKSYQHRGNFPTNKVRTNAEVQKEFACPSCLQPGKEFLKKNNMCLNCGARNHRVYECKSNGCRNCNKRHHTSICFRSTSQSSPEKPTTYGKPKLGSRTTSHNHWWQETYSTHKIPTKIRKDRVSLLVGTAKTLNTKEKRLQEVDILLDTGSEVSFIDSNLAKSLELPILAETDLILHKFGSNHSERQPSRVTTIHIFDKDGTQHRLQLYTSDIITSPLEGAILSTNDRQFIADHNIDLAITKPRKHVQPQILLGCDQLWSLLSYNGSHIVLPSGLRLIPSMLGHLVTGLQYDEAEKLAHVNTLVSHQHDNDEREMWERFWMMDSSGINEFHGPDTIERNITNEQVWKQFRETIQLRKDGYYVRLPWKDNHPPLPDNRAIAMKRLVSVLKSHKSDSWTMKEYDKTFKDQLSQGIIEEVDEDSPTNGILHYIPHQAVITPQKETTKLRVVFDASAHYKGCPSLNEVIHQGPLIMPELYGMLLRFRIPTYAIIADVEKAFLQVRLQEADRDATRCLWIREISKPPKGSNIVAYRFTRVTSGINASPFLLAYYSNPRDPTKLIRR